MSSKRIDSGTLTKVKPALTRLAYSVAPTPHVRVGSAAHAGVRVGGLDEIANLNEFLSAT